MFEIEGLGDEVVVCLTGVTLVLCYFLYQSLSFLATNSQENTRTNLDPNGPTRTITDDCAICLSETRFAVQTNCGHSYCGNCILEVWRRSSQLSAITCPYCRQRITLLLSYFSQEERTAAEPGDVEIRNKVLEHIYAYNKRHSGEPRSILEIIRDVPTLLRHLVLRFFDGDDGINFAFQLRIIALVLFWITYLLSPLDLIPEVPFN
ncbi:E3 ubiquitin-protein ligase RNF170 [Eurytemora carolleeae]|uniref:E3 ubiquitin-protein ligase RNF170 n=1 Tax=Eurytemora carolleeae TaxID=1294199 RepID=UPI000C7600C3|nr:E3 ubiquitin-protein ligase RNF170 [Eurytemora carolleeae]|eukprot:XP_023344930.1 E3 ubiquitin-protein ligase RNF170-like [Eurytemora affinis]